MTRSPAAENSIDPQPKPVTATDDLLWRQLKSVPAFRGLLRAVESRFYRGVHLSEPILDVGCGDGHFAQMTFAKPLAAGIDPWWGPLRLARQSAMYDLLLQANGNELPFAEGHFGSAFSNSVLEHIPDLPPVLKEVNRVLQEDGRFLITIPSHLFNEYLGGTAFFRKMGLPDLAEQYQSLANKITRHAHTETPEWWAEQLASAGFAVERWQYYFSPEATRALEWGHVQGLPAAIMRLLTGHWIIAPWKSSLQRTEQWLRPFYEESFGAEGAYLCIVARKQARHPLPTQLPPPHPFTLEELQPAPENGFAAAPSSITDSGGVSASPPPPATANTDFTAPLAADKAGNTVLLSSQKTARLLTPLLLLTSLLLAIIGQANMGGDAVDQAAGLRWFGYSSIPLLLLAWRRRRRPANGAGWRLPSLANLPRRRWFLFLAVILATLAHSVSGGAFLLWVGGIGTAAYALADQQGVADLIRRRPATRTLFIGLALFLLALLLRLFQLDQIPFVLNGIEASLGLDVVRIVQGQVANPFATGWLTNPLLPLYFNAIPVRILGQTTLAMRLVSPFVGAATVSALFFIGRRVWGETTALLAAILLAGGHYHLHYSRLGMTNIWDPLLLLLGLGILLMAWQRPQNAPQQRALWLIGGFFLGLNMLGFTSSRLLPIMLATLFLLTLIFNRATLRQQAPHIVAAFLMAFVVTLPMILYYRSNPFLFMERANVLGIFAGQTGWLRDQAVGSGQDTLSIFWQQIRTALLSFNISRDTSPVYRPLVPLLSFGPSILFVLGTVMALIRARSLKYSALLVWLLITILFAGAFLIEVPQSHRLVSAAPALALLAAIALMEIGRAAWTAVLPTHRLLRHPLWILSLLMLLFVLNDVAFYFVRYPTQHQYADTNTETAAVLAAYLNDLDGTWTAYFYGPPVMYIDFPTLPYLAPEFKNGVNFYDIAAGDGIPAETGGGQVFIFLPTRAAEFTAVQARFPTGLEKQISGYYADPLFTIYEVTP